MGGCAGCGAAIVAGGVRERNKSPRSDDLEPDQWPERLFSGHLSGATFLPRAATTLMGSKSQIRTMTDEIEARAWPKLQKAPDPVS